jgi:hypothetical protein
MTRGPHSAVTTGQRAHGAWANRGETGWAEHLDEGKRGRLTVGPEVLGRHPLMRGPGREGEGAGGTGLRGPKGRAVEGLGLLFLFLKF